MSTQVEAHEHGHPTPSTYAKIGLVLFIITLIVNGISRAFIWSMGRQRSPRLRTTSPVKAAA